MTAVADKETRNMVGTLRRHGRLGRLGTGLATVFAVTLALAAPAAADFGIDTFGVDAAASQAAASSDFTVSMRLNTQPLPSPPYPPGLVEPQGFLRTLDVDLPPGVLGNAGEHETCTRAQFVISKCPIASQVGNAVIYATFAMFNPGSAIPTASIYNLAPSPGQPASLGMIVADAQRIYIDLSVRTGDDYGLTARSTNIPSQLGVWGMDITLWGIPADPSHDPLRRDTTAVGQVFGVSSPAPRKTFMVNRSACDGQETAELRVTDYDAPNQVHKATAPFEAMTNCDQVPFSPSIAVQPSNPVVDRPTGMQVALAIEQNDDPDSPQASSLQDVIVRMPKGVTINPSVAFDRTSCADYAFGLRNGGAASCPPGSKIGNLRLDVPALQEPLPGDVYLGDPQPGNPFRLFLYAEGQGVRVKLYGEILADPETGQLKAVFQNNPQVPFRSFVLNFLGGQRSVMLTPRVCGSTQVEASFLGHNGKLAGATGAMRTVGDAQGNACPDPAPFMPTFAAGVTGAEAGQDTGFAVVFGRPDGHQLLSKLKMHLPAGLLGRLASFPLCPNAQANAGTCSDDSMVGGTIVSAGSGGTPLSLPGRIYLTEPPQPGQIAGLSIVVPAIVGPYNLGTPVVRAGISVNPDTSLDVVSDPLPTMLSGVELRIKQVIVNMDRPGFMFNPTDCSPKIISGSLTSVDGIEVGVESPFQVRGCSTMPLEGKFAISTTAPPKDGGTTGLTFNLGGLPGHSNVRQVQAVLPSGMGARLDGPLQVACAEADFAADTCKEESRVGVARATTPVLPEALAGNVYFIANPSGNALPRLGIRLKGAITLDVIGNVEITPTGRVATTFPAIPDVPISEFVLDLDEGTNAVLSAAGLCKQTNYADVNVIGHTGKEVRQRVAVDVAGCPSKAASKGKPKGKGGKGKKKGKKGKRG